MPYWLKYMVDGSFPTAEGPYPTRNEAEIAKLLRESPPEGFDVPDDLGEVIEADSNYPSTLKKPIARVAFREGVDEILFSDGTKKRIE